MRMKKEIVKKMVKHEKKEMKHTEGAINHLAKANEALKAIKVMHKEHAMHLKNANKECKKAK